MNPLKAFGYSGVFIPSCQLSPSDSTMGRHRKAHDKKLVAFNPGRAREAKDKDFIKFSYPFFVVIRSGTPIHVY